MDYDSARLAPPSYLLEDASDTEDSPDFNEDQTNVPPFSLDKELPSDPIVFIRGVGEEVSSSPETGTECVFLVGERGERFARGVKKAGEGEVVVTFEVLVDGEQVGLIEGATPTRPTLVNLTPTIALASLNALAQTLLKVLKPADVLIISSYHAPSYVRPPLPSGTASSAVVSRETAPLLHLSTSPSLSTAALIKAGILHPFAPPNILHGLPSALLTYASLAHPGPEQSSTLLLLPSTATPLPLNPPFPLTEESNEADAFRDSADPGLWAQSLAQLERVVKENGFDRWWDEKVATGDGFDWLVRQRRERKREYHSSMYM